MKSICFVWVLLLVFSFNAPVQAQVLDLYDDFSAPLLSPEHWIGRDTNSQGSVVLEGSLRIATEPLLGYRGLNMGLRAWGNTGVDTGVESAQKRLVFVDGSAISTILATVQVKKYQVKGCLGNTDPSEIRARLGGAFFNATVPAPPSLIDDVFAFVDVRRVSTSTAKAPVLEAFGAVSRCLDDACATSEPLGTTSLGPVRVDQKVKLRVTWDRDFNRFIFQKGTGAPVIVEYTVSDASPPSAQFGGFKRLEIMQRMANCTADRTTCGMDVFFDNVYINPQP
jgi:hypothetical protein